MSRGVSAISSEGLFLGIQSQDREGREEKEGQPCLVLTMHAQKPVWVAGWGRVCNGLVAPPPQLPTSTLPLV